MPKRKQKGTLDVVKGLMEAADEICIPGQTRVIAQCIGGSLPGTRSERKRVGKYVGRVVLMSLAAELALKFAWENEDKPNRVSQVAKTTNNAKGQHDLNDLFKQLGCCLQASIGEKYSARPENKKPGWETADKVFEKSRDAFELYRYIVEEGSEAQERMRATELGLGTRSVVEAVVEDLNNPGQG